MRRVLIIGARRRRQGIGEFVARWVADAGAEVCAVVGTSEESAGLARDNLARQYGIQCRAYSDLRRGIADERPDLVAICSPIEAHREHLAIVAEAGVHCLCEKPMWWRRGSDLAGETEAIVDGFSGRGLHLELVTQWPCTLPGFYNLYPEVQSEPLERFEMLLAPTSTEDQAVVDALPHVLSMLQALAGPGQVKAANAGFESSNREALRLDFEYTTGAPDGDAERTIEAQCRLVTCPERPRPAAYAINGRRADRVIRLPDYVLELEAREGEGEPRRVTLEDPLKVLIREVLGRIESAPSWAGVKRRNLVDSITQLEPLVDAAVDAANRLS